MFYKQVDKRYRETIVKFLQKHFRYNTMNSWNRSTSYANNIKLHNIDKPFDIDDETWWELLWVPQWQEKLSDLLEDFGNGRQVSMAEAADTLSSIEAVLNPAVTKVTVRTAARKTIRLSLRARLVLAADAMLKLV